MDSIISFIIIQHSKSMTYLVKYKSATVRKLNHEAFLEEICLAHTHNYVYKKIDHDLVARATANNTETATVEQAAVYFAINTVIGAPKAVPGKMLWGFYDFLWNYLD